MRDVGNKGISDILIWECLNPSLFPLLLPVVFRELLSMSVKER